jgi:hypothetical protein
MIITELSTVDKLRIQTGVMEILTEKYGPFPLAETVARHKQRELFSQKNAPKKWRHNNVREQ